MIRVWSRVNFHRLESELLSVLLVCSANHQSFVSSFLWSEYLRVLIGGWSITFLATPGCTFIPIHSLHSNKLSLQAARLKIQNETKRSFPRRVIYVGVMWPRAMVNHCLLQTRPKVKLFRTFYSNFFAFVRYTEWRLFPTKVISFWTSNFWMVELPNIDVIDNLLFNVSKFLAFVFLLNQFDFFTSSYDYTAQYKLETCVSPVPVTERK